jgi:hypothetical protein
VELTVEDEGDGEPLTYLVTSGETGVNVSEGSGEGKPDGYVRGSTEAWIDGLSPLGDDRGLRRGGDRGLVGAVLGLIEPGAGRAAVQDLTAGATA